MDRRRATGCRGEDLAVQYFTALGYGILQRNWRCGRLELDLIAHRQEVLHIIEVKTRSSAVHGFPEINVNQAKFKAMQAAAEEYLRSHPGWTRIQFDVLAVTLGPEIGFFLLEDVFL